MMGKEAGEWKRKSVKFWRWGEDWKERFGNLSFNLARNWWNFGTSSSSATSLDFLSAYSKMNGNDREAVLLQKHQSPPKKSDLWPISYNPVLVLVLVSLRGPKVDDRAKLCADIYSRHHSFNVLDPLDHSRVVIGRRRRKKLRPDVIDVTRSKERSCWRLMEFSTDDGRQ